MVILLVDVVWLYCYVLGYTVETVLCNPSTDLNKKDSYDRGVLNTVPIQ